MPQHESRPDERIVATAAGTLGYRRSMRRRGEDAPSQLWIEIRRGTLLLLVPAHAGRALLNPEFRRAYPAYSTSLGAILLVETVGLAGLAMVWPAAGAATVLALAASSLWFLIRARPRYGVGRGLPPGPLDVLAPGPFVDPHFYLAAARSHGAVFKCSALARSQVAITGLAAGREILRTNVSRLRPLLLPFHRFVPGGFLRRMDEPAHETYRRLFSAAVSRPLVDRWQPVLEAAAARGLARLGHATSAGDAGGVAPLPYIEQIVFESWARVFFGVDDASADAGRLADSFAIIDAWTQRRFSSASIVAALESIESCMRRATLPSVLREVIERKSDALADATILRNLIFMFSTSAGDVSGLLMWVLKHLSDHPAWADRIRADVGDGQVPAAGPGSSVAARVVSETLRLQQSEFVMREIVHPITHAGFRLPRGWLLRICVHESHRDPAVFEHPEVFDPDRFLRRAPTRDQYAPFGLDRHACIGEHLARGMAEAFARELAGCTWDVVSDGPPEMSRRRHLAPSPRFRIRLAAPINADLTTRGEPRR